jgi:hypothetical protein
MEYTRRKELKEFNLPGRSIQKAVGEDSFINSNKMTMGFAYYSKECGIMEPHYHAEETVYIIDAKSSWVRYGKKKNTLKEKIYLEPGMTLHFNELEWHVFEFEPDGFVDIIFFYGQVRNIRPEEILK